MSSKGDGDPADEERLRQSALDLLQSLPPDKLQQAINQLERLSTQERKKTSSTPLDSSTGSSSGSIHGKEKKAGTAEGRGGKGKTGSGTSTTTSEEKGKKEGIVAVGGDGRRAGKSAAAAAAGEKQPEDDRMPRRRKVRWGVVVVAVVVVVGGGGGGIVVLVVVVESLLSFI